MEPFCGVDCPDSMVIMGSVTNRELRDRALALPPDERARLAHEIIASLDGPADDGAAEAWVREIEHRVREFKDGSVKLID